MFVCVCNAVTEHDINSAIAGGCHSLRELRRQLGVGASCGRCRGCARETLREALQTSQYTRLPHPPAAAKQLALA
jgi:bacterioferritin-associated ferredoxin